MRPSSNDSEKKVDFFVPVELRSLKTTKLLKNVAEDVFLPVSLMKHLKLVLHVL